MSEIKDTIKRLADEMDGKAEDMNAHDFVITHRALAVLSAATIGDDSTLKLFAALKQEYGLPGLTGICGRKPQGGTILHRFGISEDWGDWQLPSTPNPPRA
jgi:hypothetical protein